jgi:hypothetical protein
MPPVLETTVLLVLVNVKGCFKSPQQISESGRMPSSPSAVPYPEEGFSFKGADRRISVAMLLHEAHRFHARTNKDPTYTAREQWEQLRDEAWMQLSGPCPAPAMVHTLSYLGIFLPNPVLSLSEYGMVVARVNHKEHFTRQTQVLLDHLSKKSGRRMPAMKTGSPPLSTDRFAMPPSAPTEILT